MRGSKAQPSLAFSPVPRPEQCLGQGFPDKSKAQSFRMGEMTVSLGSTCRKFSLRLLSLTAIHPSTIQTTGEQGTAFTYLCLVSWGQLRRVRTPGARITLNPGSSLAAHGQPRLTLAFKGGRRVLLLERQPSERARPLLRHKMLS